MKLRYDPNHPVSYFLYECPTCGSRFYGGGSALHNPGCTETGYENCIHIFGPAQVEAAKSKAALFGEDFQWWGLSIAILREQFPELLPLKGEDDAISSTAHL